MLFRSVSSAFTLAGVPSTVASLWEVPDKVTQEIMIDFYQYLKKGDSKANALRKAKLKYLQKTDDVNFKKPFYWAGFVAAGNMEKITTSSANYWKWGIGIFLILGLFFGLLKKPS